MVVARRCVEDDGVDEPGDEALLEVLDAGPGRERGLDGRRPGARRSARRRRTSSARSPSRGRQSAGSALPKSMSWMPSMPGELGDRVGVVVDAQVDEDVAAAAVAAARA